MRHKITGAVYIVADSRLSQLPSAKAKGDTSAKVKAELPNGNSTKDKSAVKKGGKKGDSHGAKDYSTTPVDSSTYVVIGQCKGADLVGRK